MQKDKARVGKKKHFGPLISQQELVGMEKKEIDLYEKYSDYYSYGFYIASKN
jgi:hypothetical protein